MHIDRGDLEAVAALIERAGLDEVVLRRDREEIVVRARPLEPPAIELRDVVTYRWSDGDWIVEASLALHNAGDRPLRVLTSCFELGGSYTRWPTTSTLGDAVLAPGARLAGVLSWYTSRHAPQPTQANLHWSADGGRNAAWAASHPIRLDAGRGQAGSTGASLPPGLALSAGDAVVFRWSDGDWIVRVPLRLTHAGNEPALFSRSALQCLLGGADGRPMAPWPAAGDLADVETVAPGATLERQAAWYCSGALPRPPQVQLRAAGGALDELRVPAELSGA